MGNIIDESWDVVLEQEFHKIFESNFEKIRYNILWKGICGSILHSVDKLNSFYANKHIGAKILEGMGLSALENADIVQSGACFRY